MNYAILWLLGLLLCLFLPSNMALAQSISIDQADGPVCPGHFIRYTVTTSNIPSDCITIKYTVTNGTLGGGGTTFTTTAKYVDVKWNYSPFSGSTFNGTLKAEINKTSECTIDKNDTRTFKIRSLSNQTPTFSQSQSSVNVCNTNTIRYEINRMYYTNDNVYEADSYEWTFPIGWTRTAGGIGKDNYIDLTPNTCSDGVVTVKAKGCGVDNYSQTASITVNRPIPKTLSGPNYVVCEKKDPIQFSVPSSSCATYSWNYPSTWGVSGSTTSSSITLIPDGKNAGRVTANITACSRTESPFRDIQMHLYDPNKSPTITSSKTTNPFFVCKGEEVTFTLNNPPAGTNKWSVSSHLTIISQTSTTVTVKMYIGGNGWVRSTTTSPCTGSNGLNTYTKSVDVRVGTYYDSEHPITASTTTELCPGETYLFTSPHLSGNHLDYDWQASSGLSLYRDANYCYVTPLGGFMSGQLTLRVRNACGWTEGMPAYINLYSSSYCPGTYSIQAYPNPVDEELNVEIVEDSNETSSANVAKEGEFEVKLFDSFGKVKRKATTKAGRLKLNVKNLPEGLYYLHATRGKTIIRKQILVQR